MHDIDVELNIQEVKEPIYSVGQSAILSALELEYPEHH